MSIIIFSPMINSCITPAPASEVQATLSRLSDCVTDVISWCASRRLQLNVLKTELMWIGTRQRLQQLPGADITLTVGSDVIKPVHVVRDLGVYIDDELTMKQHVGKVAGACFYHLRRLRQIRRHVSNELMAQLIYAFVTSRLDYCNSVLVGLPACTIAPLQRVQNAAARLLLNRRKTDHITDGLKDLHWLPIAFRIKYKLCMLMHSIKVGNCPSYLKDMVSLASSIRSRSGLRSADTDACTYVVPRTRTKLGERAFSSAGPTAWNSLPVSLRIDNDTKSFKRNLKTHLFIAAFN